MFNFVRKNLNDGEGGLNKGIPHGFERLSAFLPNVQKKTYYLIGGENKVGKSALAKEMFLFNPLEFIINQYEDKEEDECLDDLLELEILYFSLEESKEKIVNNLTCRKLHQEFYVKNKAINRALQAEHERFFRINGHSRKLELHELLPLYDINYISSKGKYKLDNDTRDKILSLEKYFDEVQKRVFISDWKMSADKIQMTIAAHMIKPNNGKIITEKDSDGNDVKVYVPKNPNKTVLVLIDHIGKVEVGLSSIKREIDKLSGYLVHDRNFYGISPIVLQQLGRGLDNSNRLMKTMGKFNADVLRPSLGDYKDSGNTTADANTIMSVFSPNRYEIEMYDGYSIKKLGDRFRSLSILANRDGDADLSVPMGFFGEVGRLFELPKLPLDIGFYDNFNEEVKNMTQWKIKE